MCDRSHATHSTNLSEEGKAYIGPQTESDNICKQQSASFLDLLTSNFTPRAAIAHARLTY